MKVALLGDMAFFGAYGITTNKNLLERLSDISLYLKQFDCVVGNLETPFSRKKKNYGAKSAYICADVECIEILKHLHLSAVCLANNHMFDFGTEGYECTLETLRVANIDCCCTEGKEYVYVNGKNKIAFTGFCCYTSNPLQMASHYGSYGVNVYNLQTVSDLIKSKDEAGFLNIVSVHAGIEHVNYPDIEHIKAARQLAQIAPYVYYGHHPHVIQGVETYDGSVIAHSLGNFCFDDVYTSASEKPLVELTENNRTGLILELEIEDNRVIGYNETTIYIGNDGEIQLLENPQGLIEYNLAIQKALIDSDYEKKRSSIIMERLDDRKKNRNIMWYFKRLKPRYIQILLNARRNAQLYAQNVRNYIK